MLPLAILHSDLILCYALTTEGCDILRTFSLTPLACPFHIIKMSGKC